MSNPHSWRLRFLHFTNWDYIWAQMQMRKDAYNINTHSRELKIENSEVVRYWWKFIRPSNISPLVSCTTRDTASTVVDPPLPNHKSDDGWHQRKCIPLSLAMTFWSISPFHSTMEPVDLYCDVIEIIRDEKKIGASRFRKPKQLECS